MDLRIVKVQPVSGGLHGMKISFSRKEKDRNGVTHTNEYVVNFKSAASKDFVKLFDKFRMPLIALCRLDKNIDEMDVMIESIRCNQEGKIMLKAKVNTVAGFPFQCNPPAISNDSEFTGYDKMIKLIDQLFREAGEYILGKTEKPKQIMMDLFAESEAKEKEFKFTKEEIGAMTDDDLNFALKGFFEENTDMIGEEVAEQPEPAPFS